MGLLHVDNCLGGEWRDVLGLPPSFTFWGNYQFRSFWVWADGRHLDLGPSVSAVVGLAVARA